MEIQDELVNRLNNFSSAPFLFIGAGISKRYLDLDNWSDLLQRYADEMNKPYAFYYSKAGGELPRVASLIAADYHAFWFTSSEKQEVQKDYSCDLTNIDSPLKIEICQYLSKKCGDLAPILDQNEEIDLLRDAKFDGIITTNYDTLLDYLFPELVVFVGQDELLFSNTQSVGEIYKIHGSCADPNSIVLTAEDYSKFDRRNAYLAAKLLTIFVEHPIIFLGYSLEDPDIQKILNSIALCLTNDNVSMLNDRLIFVLWDEKCENNLIYSSNYLTKENLSIPITIIKTDDFSSIYEALGTLERKLPLRILRHLKEQFYEFISTNKPTDKCKVYLDIEDTERLPDVEFVAGVGVISKIGSRGWTGIVREELLYDLVFEDRRCDPKKIATEVLPNLISGNAIVPLFKYLKKAGYLTEDGKLHKGNLHVKVIQRALKVNSAFFRASKAYEKHRDEVRKYATIAELREVYDTYHLMFYILLLDINQINPHELHQFLKDVWNEFEAEDAPLSNYRSFYRKLICLYDWLVYCHHDNLEVITG